LSVFFNFFLLFSFLSLSLGSQPRLLRRRLASPACPVPPSSELAPCLLPPSSTHAHEAAREAAALAHEAPALGGRRGGVLAIAHEGAHEATCSPRWVPPSSSSSVRRPSSSHPLPRARPSSSHPLPRGREAGAHPRSGGASRRLTGVAGPEAEPARTAEVAGARGGGHRVRAEPARSPAAGSGRSPRFFLDSGESLLLPSSSTAASPCSSSRSSHTRVRAMQHSSHEDRPRPLFFEGRTAPGSSANIRSWDVLIPA